MTEISLKDRVPYGMPFEEPFGVQIGRAEVTVTEQQIQVAGAAGASIILKYSYKLCPELVFLGYNCGNE